MKTLSGWLLACVVFCAAAAAEVRVSGEAFISSGTTKFRGASVIAYPLEAALSALRTMSSIPDMPEPLAKTITDSEGRWALAIPDETPFLLVAEGEHYAPRTKRRVRFSWKLKSPEIENLEWVMLTEKNAEPPRDIFIGR